MRPSFAASLALAALIGCGGGEQKVTEYKVSSHDVDQVFRDHDGFRTYYDGESAEVFENKYRHRLCNHKDTNFSMVNADDVSLFRHFPPEIEGDQVRVFRDLEIGEQAYTHAIRYLCFEQRWTGKGWHWDTYAEIHLPQDQEISPGNETYGGKFPVHDPMSEIK